jgi:hypothetical protein
MVARMRIEIGLAIAACALSACASGSPRMMSGDDGSGDDGGGSAVVKGTLSIEPPAVELVIANGAAAHQSFTATLHLPDGTHRDVTADTRFQIDATLGAFSGGALTMTGAGRSQVIAAYTDQSATADVVARIKSVRIDPALPPSVVGRFDGPDDAALAPQIAYPPAGAIMPRNLGDFEVHWTDNHANNVFEVSLHTEFSDVRIYVPGGNGLAAQGPTPSWAAFQASEWLAAVGNAGSVSYSVRGASATGAPGAPVGAAAAQTLQLSNEVMDGGLYYWANSGTTNVGIFRHDMSRPGQPAEEFVTRNQTGGRCVGCHVLSRDGSRMAITYDEGTGPNFAGTVDVPSARITSKLERWNFATYTPDATQLLTVEEGTLVVRDAATQAILATMTTTPPRAWVTQPDLSPDGTRLVYVRPTLWDVDYDFRQGQLYTRSYDAATHAFGPEQPLVNDGANNYYPSWSPDGSWVLYTRTDFDSSYDSNLSAIWVVKADGTLPPVALTAANAGTGITDSWARWAPFEQTLGAAGEPLFWITFSSKRDFGVRIRNTGLAQPVKRAQLWMTPFFPTRAQSGRDPSVPTFRLPFQNVETSNHTAQWTQRIVPIVP